MPGRASVAPLRIAVLTHGTLGGSSIVACELARALAARRHDVHVFSRGRSLPRSIGAAKQRVVAGAPEPPYPLRFDDDAMEEAVARAHEAVRFDVVHAHYAFPFARVALRCRGRSSNPLRVVTTLHGTDVTLSQVPRGELRSLVTASDRAAVVSPSLRAEASARTGLSLANFDVVPNFAAREDAAEAPTRRGASSGDPTFVHVSNFRPVKRVPLLVEAFAPLAPRARLVLVGDGPEFGSTKRLVTRLGLGRRVEFAGPLRDPQPVVRAARALVLASSAESFSLAALEAAACGVPTIAPRVGGLATTVAHQQTGLLVDARDEATTRWGLRRAMERLARSPATAKRLGELARRRTRARFSEERIVARYLELYAARPLATTAAP